MSLPLMRDLVNIMQAVTLFNCCGTSIESTVDSIEELSTAEMFSLTDKAIIENL
jgi:hypothetical protein